MEKILIVIAFTWLPMLVLAQPSSSYSAFSGGMIVGQSILSTTKFGYEKKHFGLSADFTFDSYQEKWSDGSESKFALYGVSVGVRYYTSSMGRGLFAEGFGGYGLTQLTTKQNAMKQELYDSDYLPVTGLGMGYRLGKKPKGLFGELGYRSTVALKNAHLYTTDDKPDPNAVGNISYQSWIFKKGKASGQFYLGIGYSF
jgi:hypothetical protein